MRGSESGRGGAREEGGGAGGEGEEGRARQDGEEGVGVGEGVGQREQRGYHLCMGSSLLLSSLESSDTKVEEP